MPQGLYPDTEMVERFLGSVAAGNITQRFIAPFDLDVLGVLLSVSAAPGSTDGVIFNVSNSPTSQLSSSQGGTAVSAYNLWTAANAPSILGTATTYPVAPATFTSLVDNFPYAQNYPLPGPSGTTGYVTAQSTTQTTESPVTSPPTFYKYGMNGISVPDNTYTDYNGVTLSPASYVHAGDVLTFVLSAGGASVSVGSAANLEMLLLVSKR